MAGVGVLDFGNGFRRPLRNNLPAPHAAAGAEVEVEVEDVVCPRIKSGAG